MTISFDRLRHLLLMVATVSALSALTAGCISQSNFASRGNQIVLSDRNDYYICSLALHPDRRAWEQANMFMQSVDEAKRRGLSVLKCAQLLGNKTRVASASENSSTRQFASASDIFICQAATNDKGDWDTNSKFKRYLVEARYRNLHLQQCSDLTGRKIEDLSVVADKAQGQTTKKVQEDRDQKLEAERERKAEAERKRKIAASKKTAPAPSSSTSGSGFFVSKLGHVITNQHVVEKCQSVTVGDSAKKQVAAEVIDTDKRNDLALLKISSTTMASADTKSLIRKLGIKVASRNVPLSSDGLLRSEDVELGERVMVSGYPYGEIFSDTIKVTGGMVSAIRGMGDDSGQFQIDAAVQPGNSGGPIYDDNGNIVGVVVSQLNKLKVAKIIGSLPENVNFGIKASTVRQFLTSAGLPTKWSNQSEPVSSKNLAKIAKNQTLMVVCNN
jgi:S1-C subfamily serine protease